MSAVSVPVGSPGCCGTASAPSPTPIPENAPVIQRFTAHLLQSTLEALAIARSLVGDPDLILADEPTGNLDTGTSHEIMDLFTALNRDQNITIVLVTHEADVARYAHRLVRFLDGSLEGDGPTETLLTGVML